MKGILIIFAGLPSSGKSTLAQVIETRIDSCFPPPRPPIMILDPDRFRGYDEGILQFQREKETQIRHKLLLDAERCLRAGQFTIIDDLNYYQSMRHDLLRLCLEIDVPYVLIYVTTPLETCLAWNLKRGSKIPNTVIEQIAQKFDYFERYAWDHPDISVDPSSQSYSATVFLNLLCKSIDETRNRRPRLLLQPQTNLIQTHSIKEMLDLRSRKIINQFIQSNGVHIKKAEIIKIRKDLLRKNPANLEETENILEAFQNELKTLVLKNTEPAPSNPK